MATQVGNKSACTENLDGARWNPLARTVAFTEGVEHRRWCRVTSALPEEGYASYFTEEDVDMLVLSRKRGETVRIGPNITVTFLGVRGQVTRIGIDAPSVVRILRGELSRGAGLAKPLDDGSPCNRLAPALDR